MMLEELVQRGSIILVCDFAMGFLSSRLAPKVGLTADQVHQDLRRSLVPNAFAVPSGIFGLARAQNAAARSFGCRRRHRMRHIGYRPTSRFPHIDATAWPQFQNRGERP